jgi:DNA polymerase III epsilon subunit-like protein
MIDRSSLPIAFLDTETSDLEAHENSRLVEVAVLKWRPAGYYSYESFVRADDVAYSWDAMAAHHLRPEDTSRAPAREAVIEEVRSFLDLHDVTHIVAHNAPFDRKWLVELGAYVWLDSMKLARRAWESARSHKNFALFHGFALERGLIAGRASHRALTDALATSEVFFHALQALGLDGNVSIADIEWAHNKPFTPSVMWYGKHRGKKIATIETSYLQWMLREYGNLDDDTRRAIVWTVHQRLRKMRDAYRAS